MSHPTTRFVVPMLVMLAAAAQQGSAQASGTPAQPVARTTEPATDRSASEQAIRALSQRWLAAVRSKDLDGVMAHFATEAAAVYGGKLLTGADAIRQQQAADFASIPKERPGYVPSWQTTAVEVAQSGDMAYESGTYDDSWNGGKDRERGNYLTVWRKVGEDWKVVRDVAVPEPKAGAAKNPAP